MSILAYLTSFIVGIVISVAVGYEPSLDSEIPMSLWRGTLVVSSLVVALFGMWYFQSSNTQPSLKNWLLFCLCIVVVGFILDLVVLLIASWSMDAVADFGSYYYNPMFVLTLLAMFVVAWFVGHTLEKDM